MVKKTSTQAQARATSGALALAQQKQKRAFNKVMKTKAGTDAGVEADDKWVQARKEKQKLRNKQLDARSKAFKSK